jgi:hypothetical protein
MHEEVSLSFRTIHARSYHGSKHLVDIKMALQSGGADRLDDCSRAGGSGRYD